jgi:hypothetical protein
VDGLVIQNQAFLAALHNSRLDQLSNASSLQAINEGLADVSDSDVDRLLSNYFITRLPAEYAYGQVKVVVQTNTSYTIQSGFRLAYSTLSFATNQIHRVYPVGSNVTETDTFRLLRARSDGKFEFTITVVAAQYGAASRLALGTALTIVTPASGMLSAAVAADFAGGTAAETNEQLMARAAKGVTARVVAGDQHTAALVAATYPTYQIASIGAGDALMTRDRYNILGIGTGGKIDVYTRTSNTVGTKTIQVGATVLNALTKQVRATLTAEQASGLYRVSAIRPHGTVGSGGNEPDTYVRSPVTLAGWNPAIQAAIDAAFTARQQVQVTWIDTIDSGLFVNGEVRQYDMDLVYMPDLTEFDAFMTAQDIRPGGTDILVKAGVPCVVSVNLQIKTLASYAQPDAAEIASAVANQINSLPFGTEVLSSYTIHRVISPLAPNSDVTAITLSGTVYGQDDIDYPMVGGTSLTIATNTGAKFSPENTFFSCQISNVVVTLV